MSEPRTEGKKKERENETLVLEERIPGPQGYLSAKQA